MSEGHPINIEPCWRIRCLLRVILDNGCEWDGLVFKPSDQLAMMPMFNGPEDSWKITHRKSGYMIGGAQQTNDVQAQRKLKRLLPLADWGEVFKIAYGRGGKP